MMKLLTHPKVARDLAFAILTSSTAPALLLDEDFTIIAASTSFYLTFALAPEDVIGRPLFDLHDGEWNVPQLRSLLVATLSGHARIDAYEMDLEQETAPRRLVLNAQKLDYDDAEPVRLLLTVSDVTEARLAEKLKDDLLREKAILLQELQHRVANSLQIIASVLMLSARRVQSEETRGHLRNAHDRVMSIAAVQQQLAASRLGDVELRGYFTQLCQSLGASMIHDHKLVSIEVDVDGSSVDASVSVSLGLIITELVINALKHAFPGNRGGKILVDYHARESAWTLSVSDNGIGTPELLGKTKPGLGTIIIKALASQLDARVEALTGQPGTKISIVHIARMPNSRAPTEKAA